MTRLSSLIGLYVPWLMSVAWLAAGKRGSADLIDVFKWSQIDFDYPSEEARELAILSGNFKPENALPLGLEITKDRIFITLPMWKTGIPATLAWIPKSSPEQSPKLKPYPNWDWHADERCNGITSVFRIVADECNRLWVLDSGVVDIAGSLKRVCTPQILAFDLETDELLWRYVIPKQQLKPGTLLSNLAVDVRDDCDDAFIYASDVFRYGIIVYSLKENRSWRVEHSFFYPEPLNTRFRLDGINFRWNDGIFGLALSPYTKNRDRQLFFHPLASFREFSIKTSILRNETKLEAKDPDFVKVLGEPRRKARGHASGSGMDRNGVLFYNMVSRSGIGCWNSRLGVHNPQTQGVVAINNATLSFPNDLKVDREEEQSIWVLSNRLHRYLYGGLNPYDKNFRILTMRVKDAVKGTPCEEGFLPPPKKPRKCQEL